MDTSFANKIMMALRWGLAIAVLLVVSVSSYNPWIASAFAISIIMVVVVSYKNTISHEGGIRGFFFNAGSENRIILLLLTIFASYTFAELRSIDSASHKDNEAVLTKLNTDGDKFISRLDQIDNKLATTTNGRLATNTKDIGEAFVITCVSASKKIRAAFNVSASPNASKYFTNEIIALMKTKDRVVYEVVFIVDKNSINSGNVDNFDKVIEKEWNKRFAEEGLDDRFSLKIIQSETPLYLDVLIADDDDVYLSFFNRQINKPNINFYRSDQVIFYQERRDIALYFGEWFNKSIWERALTLNDWKNRRILLN